MLAALIAAPVLGLAGGAMAQPMTRETKEMAMKDAEAQYKVDKTACDGFSGNTKDICIAEAKGRENISKTSAEARFENTAKNREKARIAPADAAFAVSKEKCDDASANLKEVCLKEASATHLKALAAAKVDRVTSDVRKETNEKTAELRKDASEKTAEVKQEARDVKQDADFKVATAKCEGLAGSTKDTCLSDAKAKFGKM
jgi:hypothetical protein